MILKKSGVYLFIHLFIYLSGFMYLFIVSVVLLDLFIRID